MYTLAKRIRFTVWRSPDDPSVVAGKNGEKETSRGRLGNHLPTVSCLNKVEIWSLRGNVQVIGYSRTRWSCASPAVIFLQPPVAASLPPSFPSLPFIPSRFSLPPLHSSPTLLSFSSSFFDPSTLLLILPRPLFITPLHSSPNLLPSLHFSSTLPSFFSFLSPPFPLLTPPPCLVEDGT